VTPALIKHLANFRLFDPEISATANPNDEGGRATSINKLITVAGSPFHCHQWNVGSALGGAPTS